MNKLSIQNKIAYGSAGIGDAAAYSFVGTYLMFFLTTVAHVKPALAGTIIGLGIAWFIFSYVNDILWICVCIITLQIIVEMLITRHYALAVMFLTPMGILLAETGSSTSLNPDYLLKMRFLEILIGSAIGCIGGWFLYNERIRFSSIKNLRKSKIVLSKSFLK